MRKTVHKIFWLWEFEKEEKWLNEMSAMGLQLISVGFCRYIFEDGLPNEYNYRLDFYENTSRAEKEKYVHFLEETGVEHIGNLLRWGYFRKKTVDGQFELYSDISSKLNYLKRIFYFMLIFVPMLLIAGVNNLNIYYFNDGFISNLVIGCLNLLLLLFYFYGLCIFFFKIRKLKKEKQIRE